jgi:hypothetical protein
MANCCDPTDTFIRFSHICGEVFSLSALSETGVPNNTAKDTNRGIISNNKTAFRIIITSSQDSA